MVKPKQLQHQPLHKRTKAPAEGPVDSKKCATSHDVAFSRATTTVLVRQLFEQCFFEQINYGGAVEDEPLPGEATTTEDEASRDNEVNDKATTVKEEMKEANKADTAFEPTWIGEPLEPKVGHIFLAQKIMFIFFD